MADLNSRLFVKCATAIKEIGLHNFEKHLDKLISGKNEEIVKDPVVEYIITSVSKKFGIQQVILKRGIGDTPSFALSVTYFLVKQNTQMSFKAIAKYFDRNSHSTIHTRYTDILNITQTGISRNNYKKFKALESELEIELKNLKT